MSLVAWFTQSCLYRNDSQYCDQAKKKKTFHNNEYRGNGWSIESKAQLQLHSVEKNVYKQFSLMFSKMWKFYFGGSYYSSQCPLII